MIPPHIRQTMIDRLVGYPQPTISGTLREMLDDVRRQQSEQAEKFVGFSDDELFEQYTLRVYQDGQDNMKESFNH